MRGGSRRIAARRLWSRLLHAALAVLLLGAAARCAREGVSRGPGGGLALKLTLPADVAVPPDSFRLWILDAGGRPLVPPVRGPLDGSGTLDLSCEVPAGEDRLLWMEWTGTHASGLETEGPFRASVAAGSAAGVDIRPGQASEALLALRSTVPRLFPVEAAAGRNEVVLRWSRVEGALEYRVIREGEQGTASWVLADTFLVLPVQGLLRSSGETAEPRNAGPADSTYFQVQSRLVRGQPSAFSGVRAARWSDLTGLPAVLSVLPSDAVSGVPDSSEVVLVFSQEMNPSSAEGGAARLVMDPGGLPVEASLQWTAPDRLVLRPAARLPWGAHCRVQVSPALLDSDGRPLDQQPAVSGLQPFESAFEVEPYRPLQVVAVEPADGAQNVGRGISPRLILNRKARSTTIDCSAGCTSVLLADSAGNAIPCSVRCEQDSMIVVTPDEALSWGALYRLTVTSQVRDRRGREGDPLDQDAATVGPDPFRSSFRVEPEPPDPVGPGVIAVVPLDGERNAPIFRPIRLTFSRPVRTATLSGNVTLVRERGNLNLGISIYPDFDRRSLRIVRTGSGGMLEADQTYFVRVGEGVLDDAGIAFDQDSTRRGRQPFQSRFRAEKSPAVLSSSPLPDASRVPLDSALTLRFDQAVARAGIEQGGVVLADAGGPIEGTTFSLSSDTTVLTITPGRPLEYWTNYVISADSTVRSVRGDRFDQASAIAGYQPFLLRFTTVRDSVPPRVTDSYPLPLQTGVPQDAVLRVTFSQPVVPFSVWVDTIILERLGADTTLVSAGVWASADSLEAYLEPSLPLAPRTNYRLTVTEGVVDRFGAHLDQDPSTPVPDRFICVFQAADSSAARPRPAQGPSPRLR